MGVSIEELRARASQYNQRPATTATLFADRATNPKNLVEIVRALYGGACMDDYPSVRVDLSMGGGRQLAISSKAWQALMLPWTITDGGKSFRTWNPDISRALAALLPAGFLNRDRLAGDRLVEELVWRADWLYGEAVNAQGIDAQIEPILRRFHVDESPIANDELFNEGGSYWSAKLSSPELGSIRFAVHLLRYGWKVSNPAPFLRDADLFVRRVRKLGWLTAYLAANPRADVLIQYVDNHALGRYEKELVVKDLEMEGRPDVAKLIAPLLDRSIGMYVQNGKDCGLWIVLPDGRSLLHFGTPLGAEARSLSDGDLMKPDGSIDGDASSRVP